MKVMNKNRSISEKMIAIMCVILAVLILSIFIVFFNINTGNDKDKEKNPYKGEVESIKIETEYGHLEYPEKWEMSARIEAVEDKAFTAVNFYGTVKGKEEQQLFTVYFGNEGEIPIGRMMVNDTTIDVGISFSDLNTDGWAKEERDELYEMQEDVNFIIVQLEEDYNLKRF